MKWGVLGSWFLNDYIRVNSVLWCMPSRNGVYINSVLWCMPSRNGVYINSVLWCMPSRNGVYINSYFNYRVEQQKSSVSELMIYSETDSSLHT